MTNICTPLRIDHLDGNINNVANGGQHEVARVVPSDTADNVWICYSNRDPALGANPSGGIYLRSYDYVAHTLGTPLTVANDNSGTGRYGAAPGEDNRWPHLAKLTDGTLICLYSATSGATSGVLCKETNSPHDGTDWTAETELLIPVGNTGVQNLWSILDLYTDGTDVFALAHIEGGTAAGAYAANFPGYGTGDIWLLRRTGVNTWGYCRIVNNINDNTFGKTYYSKNFPQVMWFKNAGTDTWRIAFVGSEGPLNDISLRASSVITSPNTTWSTQAGSYSSLLYQSINETSLNTTNYIVNDANETTAIEIKFATNSTTPVAPLDYTHHTIHIYALRMVEGAANLDWSLKQGTTQISVGTINVTNTGVSPYTNYTDYQIVLTEAQARSITDYTDLRLTFAVNGITDQRVRIAWAYIAIPKHQAVWCWHNQAYTPVNEFGTGTGNDTSRWTRTLIHDFTSDAQLDDRSPLLAMGSDNVLRCVYFDFDDTLSKDVAHAATSVDWGASWSDYGRLDDATVNSSTYDAAYDRGFSIDSENRWFINTCGDTPDIYPSDYTRFTNYMSARYDGTGWGEFQRCDIQFGGSLFSDEVFDTNEPGGSYWIDNQHIRFLGASVSVSPFNMKLYLIDTLVPVLPTLVCPPGTADYHVLYGTEVTICAESLTAGHSYVWSGPNGYTATTRCITIVVTTATEGTYTVRITDDASGVYVDCPHVVSGYTNPPEPPVTPPPVIIPEYPLENRLFRRGVIKVQRSEIPQRGATSVAEVERLD